jgi:hypothetical protein
MFIYSSLESTPPPLSSGTLLRTVTVTSFPTLRLLGRCRHSWLLWPACLSTVPWGSAPPPLSGAQGAPPSLLHFSFFFSATCSLFSLFFSLFSLGGGQSVQGGYADLAQGCLWEYRVPLSSPGGLLLTSRLGAGVWWHGSPPGFSV